VTRLDGEQRQHAIVDLDEACAMFDASLSDGLY
jgi:hypothetical protein